jgi:hypothetical protein
MDIMSTAQNNKTIQNEFEFIHKAQPMTNSSPVGGCSIPRGQMEPGSCIPHGPENQRKTTKVASDGLKNV